MNTSAQNSQVTYFMQLPQNHLLNPAIRPDNSIYLGLPALSGVYAGINNDFLELTDIFIPGLKSGSNLTFQQPDFDLNKIVDKLKDQNNISANVNLQLFGLGFTAGKDLYFFIDIIDRVETEAVFPKNYLKLLINGNDQFLNQNIDLSGLNLKTQYFREFGFGFSKDVTEKLRVGAKVKLLAGIVSGTLDNRTMSLEVNDPFSQTVKADASFDISGNTWLTEMNNDLNNKNPSSLIKDYALNSFSNPGLGVDFGAVYNLNKMISLSASVTDLGFINWKNDLKSYVAKNSFVLSGLSLKDVVDQNISGNDLVREIKDTLRNSFIKSAKPSSYRTYLPADVLLGANLNLFQILSFGVLSSSKIYYGQIKEALTLSANAYIGKVLSGSLSYTAANYTYNNFGIGIACKTGPVQIYMTADKIPSKWSKVYIEKPDQKFLALSLPDRWYALDLQFGVNILFGKMGNKKVDKPMILIE
jgi:hypothetical protein